MLSAELPNARTALRTLMETGETELYADLVVGLRPLWRSHGYELDSQLDELAGRTDLSAGRRIDLLYLEGGLVSWSSTDSTGAARAFAAALKLLEENPNAVQEAALRGGLAEIPRHPGGDHARQEDLTLARDAGLRSGDPEVVAMTAIRALGLWPDKSEAHLAEAEAALESARQMNNEILQSGLWSISARMP